MDQDAFRILRCRACTAVFLICKSCYRNHKFCSRACRSATRTQSIRRAGRKYRGTDAGRRGNARRQIGYYHRNKAIAKNLTHQSSHRDVDGSIIPPGYRDSASQPTVDLGLCVVCRSRFTVAAGMTSGKKGRSRINVEMVDTRNLGCGPPGC